MSSECAPASLADGHESPLVVRKGEPTAAAGAENHAEHARITGMSEPGHPRARMIEGAIIVLALLIVFFMVVGVPLPIVVTETQGVSISLNFYDISKDMFCAKLWQKSRSAGAMAVISELMCFATVILLTKEFTNKPLVNFPAFHKFFLPVWMLLTNVFMMTAWGSVANMRTADHCGRNSRRVFTAYGPAFGLILFSWLLHLALVALFAARRVLFPTNRYSIFALLGIGRSLFVPSGNCGTKAEVTQAPLKGWEWYTEKAVLYGHVGLVVVVVIAIPQEMVATDMGSFSMFLRSKHACSGDQSRQHAGGAFGIISILVGTLAAIMLQKEFGDGHCLAHKLSVLPVLALQSFSTMMTWSLVAAVFNKTACKGESLKDAKGAAYETGFIFLVLVWLGQFAVLGLYCLRKFTGGKRPIEEMPKQDLSEEDLRMFAETASAMAGSYKAAYAETSSDTAHAT